jgi:hypothetical protein
MYVATIMLLNMTIGTHARYSAGCCCSEDRIVHNSQRMGIISCWDDLGCWVVVRVAGVPSKHAGAGASEAYQRTGHLGSAAEVAGSTRPAAAALGSYSQCYELEREAWAQEAEACSRHRPVRRHHHLHRRRSRHPRAQGH